MQEFVEIGIQNNISDERTLNGYLFYLEKKISSIKEMIKEVNYGSNRVSILKRLLVSKDIVRVLECHNPIGGKVVENTKIIKD